MSRGNRLVGEDWDGGGVGITNYFLSEMRLKKFVMQGSFSASVKDEGYRHETS